MRQNINRIERVWVVVPIETKAREFHAKLLFSCMAAEAGFGVVLGNKTMIEQNVLFFPRGLFVGNNIVEEKGKLFRRYRKLGYKVVAWCEEGVTYRNRRDYRHDRVSSDAVSQIEAFFAWGEYHAEDVRLGSRPEDAARIFATGNPRFDLLRPEYRGFYRKQADNLLRIHGPMILVNTNFHRYNHFLGKGSYLEGLRARGKLHTPEQEEFSRRWIEFLGEMYHHFAQMIPALSRAFPKHKIIIRPHPSEDFDSWRKDLAGLDNVAVIHEGSVIPWILASSAVVHNSCATGCEAFVLGIPVFAYRPVASEEYDSYLPNAVSHQVSNVQELIESLQQALQSGSACATPEQIMAANHHFSGLQGPLACERIIDVLKAIPAKPRPFASSALKETLQSGARQAWPPLRAVLRRMVRGRNKLTPYLNQKFSDLELNEVQNCVQQFADITGRFSGIQVDPVGKYTFRIVNRQ